MMRAAARRGDSVYAAMRDTLAWHDDQGFALFTKRLTDGRFVWPTTREQVTISLSKADLSLLLEGVDWRAPARRIRPSLAG